MKSMVRCFVRRVVPLSLLLLFFVGGSVLAWRSSQKEPVPAEPERPVKVESVVPAGSLTTLRYYGILQGARRVTLAFRVYGPLVELPVLEGQSVKKGQLLARLDDRDYLVKVENASAGLALAQSRLTQAKSDFDRATALRRANAISQAAFEQARTAYRLAGSGVESSQAQLRAARDALADTRLVAPFDGVVTRKFVENFQDLQAMQPVLELQTVGDLEIRMNVPDMDMSRFPGPGNLTGTASFDALPGKDFPVIFKDMGAQADPLTRTYPVTVKLARSPEGVLLLPGMPATVTVTARPLEQGAFEFSLSPNALAAPEGRTLVWRVQQGVVHPVEVKVLRFIDGRAVVTGPLKVGDLVVTAGVSALHADQPVRPLAGAR